jgi:hypothetical protein
MIFLLDRVQCEEAVFREEFPNVNVIFLTLDFALSRLHFLGGSTLAEVCFCWWCSRCCVQSARYRESNVQEQWAQ